LWDEHGKGGKLQFDTFTRFRRVLGDDHPDTLTSASWLAANLRELGKYRQAHALDQVTLAKRRQILGNDHPDTLTSANNLAVDQRALGEPRPDQRAARRWDNAYAALKDWWLAQLVPEGRTRSPTRGSDRTEAAEESERIFRAEADAAVRAEGVVADDGRDHAAMPVPPRPT
jgi:hypothetical protein